MQKGHRLQFTCQKCTEEVGFSVFDALKIPCEQCGTQYSFDDPDLTRQLKKFEALCRQIQESEEILGNSSVGVDLGDQSVKIPYKILLSRLNATLDLLIGDQPVSITFRMEPAIDLANQG